MYLQINKCQGHIQSTFVIKIFIALLKQIDEVAEWLRRWTANPMGSARVGSNPIFVGHFLNPVKGREPYSLL